MAYTRERYNASKRPTWSADELRAEFDRVQRGMAHETVVDARDFGVKPGGAADNEAILNKALVETNAAGRTATFFLPRGIYAVTNTVEVPGKVRFRGEGRDITKIIAGSGFPTDTPVVDMGTTDNGFACRIEDLSVDGNNVDGSVGIFSDRLEETSGLWRMFVRNCQKYAIHFDGRSTTVQQYTMERIEVNLSGDADSSSVGIFLQVHNNGGLVYGRDWSVARLASGGGLGDGPGTCVRLDGVTGFISGIHIERCETDGILIGEASPCTGLVLSGIDANPSAALPSVVRISTTAATKSRGVTIMAVRANASALLIDDEINGYQITDTDLGHYSIGEGTPVNSAAYPTVLDEWTETSGVLDAGDNDDYSIDPRTRVLRIQANGSTSTITGIAGGANRRRLRVLAVNNNGLLLGHQNTGSDAANRIICPNAVDLHLAEHDSAWLEYDGSTQRWRVVSVQSADSVVSKTNNYTATGRDRTILVDTTAGARTITLPAAAGVKHLRITIKKTDSSGNAVTIDGDGSETIDGATTQSLASQYDAMTVQSDGSNWHIIGVGP